MKVPNEMTLVEIELIIHQHEWLTEHERRQMFLLLANVRSCTEQIIQRLHLQTQKLDPCDCSYCEEARERKEKEPPIHFSLD